jgi:hypothetical protein
MSAGSHSGAEAVKPGGIMRALLFTVFGVFFAATAGVTYLALSPAPEQSSDSLKLVIETGSIPERQTAEAGSDAPTGALGSETASGESENRPSLDEVIAARLQQAGQREPAEASSAGDDGTQPSSQTVAQSGPTASEAADAANNAAASDTASTAAETGFEAPATASPPPGTVSITQMLAAELNNDEEDSGDSADDAQQASAGPSGDAAASETASDSTKSAGRLPQAADSEPAAEPTDETATLASAESGPQSGSASETEIAALAPDIADATPPDTQSADTTAPEVTQEQPPAEPEETTAQPEEEPESLPRPLSAAEAPALPRQRGDFAVKGRIALIVRGLGVDAGLTERAIAQMPHQVAMGFVPYGEDLTTWTQRAQADRHDILIQIPLEPNGYPENNPGPHTLLTSLSIDENLEHLDWLLDRFDGVTGVTNYLGDKFASSPGSFAPMLMELKARDLLYVDDSKAANATTRQLARQVSLAYSVADIVIDTEREPEAITRQLEALETQAREDGAVVAIGHAHADTLSALESWLGTLNDRGLALVPITEVVAPPTPRVSQSTGG